MRVFFKRVYIFLDLLYMRYRYGWLTPEFYEYDVLETMWYMAKIARKTRWYKGERVE
jgi:hypothetical protein